MREINKIILHCSATREGKNFTAADIKKWHVQENGWKDIGYHYIIRLDGTIEKGRPEDTPGAHTTYHNHDSIGVCYVGGVDNRLKAKDTRTPQQKASLRSLVAELQKKYPNAKIYGHYQFANKDCPSFKVEDL